MTEFEVRLATAADLDVISHHRARMFRDMGELSDELFDSFRRQSLTVLQEFFAQNKYVGWVAALHEKPDKIIAGAGISLRQVAPHPQPNAAGDFEIVSGRQAIIQNVYTDPDWRRRGLAALLIKTIIDWAREQRIESVVLHASEQGRALYERLGFVATTEMRLMASPARTSR